MSTVVTEGELNLSTTVEGAAHTSVEDHLVFRLDDRLYAIEVGVVGRTLRAAYLTPLPEAPLGVLGVLNLGGEIVPFIDLRHRFSLPPRAMALQDRLIVFDMGRPIGAVVDEVVGLFSFSLKQYRDSDTIYPELVPFIKGIAKLAGEAVVVFNPAQLFSTTEQQWLQGFKSSLHG